MKQQSFAKLFIQNHKLLSMLQNFESLVLIWLALGLITFIVLLKIPAPYGKFSKTNWGPMIPSKFGWFIMEIISPTALIYFFLNGDIEKTSTNITFITFWALHYFNRSVIYPLRQNNPSKMPLIIAVLAFLFNVINGYINGTYLGSIQDYSAEYLSLIHI